MNRTHKIIVTIAAAGVGLVLAANPSNAMPWGDSLRPSFLSVPHERTEEPRGITTVSGDDESSAPAADTPAGDDGAVAPEAPAAPPAGHDEPATTAAPNEPATTSNVAPPATTQEPPATTPAVAPPSDRPAGSSDRPAGSSDRPAGSSDRPAGSSDRPKEPEAPHQPETTEPPATTVAPQEPEHPDTTAPRPEERRPATLSLHCELGGGVVSCAWEGPTPDGAVRQLVLRGDQAAGRGRVLLNTEQTDVRSFVDTRPEAGHTYSYVVVFLDGNGKTLAHANLVLITVPAAPTTPEPTTPPTTPQPTSPEHHGDAPLNG